MFRSSTARTQNRDQRTAVPRNWMRDRRTGLRTRFGHRQKSDHSGTSLWLESPGPPIVPDYLPSEPRPRDRCVTEETSPLPRGASDRVSSPDASESPDDTHFDRIVPEVHVPLDPCCGSAAETEFLPGQPPVPLYRRVHRSHTPDGLFRRRRWLDCTTSRQSDRRDASTESSDAPSARRHAQPPLRHGLHR